MTQTYIPETPMMSRPWCPVCEPEADPTMEILETHRCGLHQLDFTGYDDLGTFSGGYKQAGDANNRVFCNWLHRRLIEKETVNE